VARGQRRRGGFATQTSACPTCGGTGRDPGATCPTCRGSGAVDRERRVTVTIPAGAEDGSTLRLRGLGGAGTRGGPPGDLLLHVQVLPDPVFRREGNDVHSDVPVPAPVAALGGKARVRTLRGEGDVAIPPGTSSGAVLRLRGQGIAGGDHLAHVQVTVPERLGPEQRALYEKLRDL
jgi:molecular chaperone DnaJ